MAKVDDRQAGSHDPDRQSAAKRRPYVAPELIEYGSVAKLTQTGGLTEVDFLLNLRRMV